jgi:amino acid adenylation domain-containing protein
MNTESESHTGIAVVGMAGRFPGAESVEELWSNLTNGKECLSFFDDATLAESGLDGPSLRKRGHYVPVRGILKDADCFDAAFFGVHPKEAEVMDPQHRLFLEICWTALEHSGYAPSRMDGSVGVFGGATFNTYYEHVLQQRQDLIDLVGTDLVMFGNEKDYLTTRVAYKLGLKGPAVNVSTACSTSLVAVAQACQSLLMYQCDTALAGGSSITLPQARGYFHDEGNIGSSDGHTRTFDVRSSGTAFSNGVAVVVLKRLADAIEDGDQVYAVIKGAALNNDGSQRVSFGAPGVEGQSEVIAMAHALASIAPDTITYVEAHGTATPLGDPIEVAALTKAFRLGTDAKQFCGLGSVKTNLGHLDVAAGVTGLIKVALSLHEKVIPPSLHFTAPNPRLDLESSPFYVNAALQSWKAISGVPRRAGVSSFGTGGTNAHVVLEEAPPVERSGPSRPWQLLVLSAKTPEAMNRATSNLVGHLRKLDETGKTEVAARALADGAYTLQTGRSDFVHRRMVVCRDGVDGAALLDTNDSKRVFTSQQQLREPPVVFMFPGQGAQYPGMGAALYRSEPEFRNVVNQCAELLRPVLDLDLCEVLFPESGQEKRAAELLVQTRLTQPALFTVEYALAKLWISWGIRPAAMIGHSVGEYVAGCLAGVFSLEDALALVARRGALVQALPGGAMLAVRLPEAELTPLLGDQVAVAAVNAPSLCVVAGPYDAIAAVERTLADRGVVTRHLHTSHAFHSPMMDAVLEPFADLMKTVRLNEPTIPYVSNVTAQWITPEKARSVDYWASHLRRTVRFADGVAELLSDPRRVLLEVGPGQTLSTLARQHPSKTGDQIVVSTLPFTGEDELRGPLEALGRLWMSGCEVDWTGFHAHERRRRVALPTYPFERKPHWPEPQARDESSIAAVSMSTLAAGEPLRTAAPAKADETTMSVPAPVSASRRERLLGDARALLQDLSGYDLAGVDASTSLLELGLDSLLLTQASTVFQRRFGIRITFRQLMEEIDSLDAIATHLDTQLPPDPEPASSTPASASPTQTGASQNAILEQLFQQQQQLTKQLLELMGKEPPVGAGVPGPGLRPPVSVQTSSTTETRAHGPFRPMDRGVASALTPVQARALETLIARYGRRTAGSKRVASANRASLADPRSAAGFKQLWKEIVYPIVTTRSDGSRLWDVDGNEYVDFVMGFGANLFGHRPPFVVEAVRDQLERGFEIGPIQPLAGDVARLVQEFTGAERVGFTNTGSEAVLAATRVSRTITGRERIVVFAGSYHGIFDEVLFRPISRGGEPRAAALAPGIPESALGQVVVLEYGHAQSLDYLRAHGSEIAAVLVEPVQSRRLDVQPREFLHELRRVTEQTGTALIFDEVVLGFRLQPGGAQSYFGVRADLATYGKVIGGGLPVGVVAGASKFMDALDGGRWSYGDTSFPEVGVTFFAGTFVRHPLALAAAKAVLTHLKEMGPQLQEGLNARTATLAAELRTTLDEFGAPYQLTQFSSLMHLTYPGDQRFAPLFYYFLRDRGIHMWDNRVFVVTTAHTEEDLRTLTSAFRDSLSEMRSAEFLTGPGRSSSAGHTPQHPGSHEPADDAFPLTEAQKEVWVASQMGGDAVVAYNESLKLEFHGAFDVDVFRAAARHVVRRHPILLASISDDGQRQRLNPTAELEVPVADFSGEIAGTRDRRVAALIAEETSEPFDLVRGPLLRVRAAKLSHDHWVVIWTAHHVVCDGWSGGLVISEVAEMYSALKQGRPPRLEEPVSFRDYVASDESESEESIAYWRHQFNTLPSPMEIPTDRTRPKVRSSRAFTVHRDLNVPTQQLIKRAAGQFRTTPVVLMLAVFKTLLYRVTGQSDLVVGLGAAGQALTGKTCMVGHCLNLLPIRTQLDPQTSFQDNLTAVKRVVLDGYDHQQCTLGTMLKHVRVPRSLARPPLVEVLFNVDRDPGAVEFDGVRFTCERNAKRALHFELFVNVVDGPRGIRVECDANADLFDPETIERWLGSYETLLVDAATNPTAQISRLRALSEPDYHELAKWNTTHMEVPPGTVADWFTQQAENTPGRVAVTFAGVSLTYADLERRSNQFARHLKTLGVSSEVVVGLLLERSLEMVVALLGVMKAGAAYVPLDPSFPLERLIFMIEDSEMPVMVTHQDLDRDLAFRPANIVRMDADRAAILAHSDAPMLASERPPDQLAYVLYTSGSTGKPKGVEIPHSALANFLSSMQREPGFTASDSLLAVTTLSFDIAGLEIYLPLISGGKLVIASREEAQDPNLLMNLMRREQCSVMQATPATWQALVAAGWDGASELRILCGGESLPRGLAGNLLSRSKELWNMYGPTETTVWSTVHRVTSADGPIPIGRPIANTECFVFDAAGNLVLRGALGELCIGGAGLARGYRGRAELTQERFIPNPLEPSKRIYRTGDTARWLADGSLECLGRLDNQVKIRGFRIELGEIEAVLSRHEAVSQCAVVVREDTSGDKRLVAYFEPRTQPTPTANDFRQYVRTSLPDYMVPSLFVPLDQLPLTPNGKIDRKALPHEGALRIDDQVGYLAPRDSLEANLAEIWSKVLNVPRVGIRDNFFDLGGHSLTAVFLLAEIKKATSKTLPLATLFQASTIADLADLMRHDAWEPSWSSLVPIQPLGTRTPLFLVHGAEGNVLLYRAVSGHLGPDQPTYGLQSRGLDGSLIEDSTVESMASAYIKDIRTVQPSGPYYIGGYCMGGTIALEMAQQLRDAGERVELVVMLETYNESLVSRWKARLLSPLHFVQNVWFHVANVMAVPSETRSDFIREKLDVELTRWRIWFDAAGRFLFPRGSDESSYAHLKIKKTNDRAASQYIPRPYVGRVAVIRPQGYFTGLSSRSYGWEGLVQRLEVHNLPVYPRGMLVEPFSRRLAYTIAGCIDPRRRGPKSVDRRPVIEGVSIAGDSELTGESHS